MVDLVQLFPQGFNPSHFDAIAPQRSSLDLFRSALVEAGLSAEYINDDGKIHRIPTKEDTHSKKSGWYIFFNDLDIQSGAYGDWRTGLNQNWASRSYHSLTPEQKNLHQSRMDEIKQRREDEKKAEQKIAANKANEIWRSAPIADPAHPYFIKKKIKSFGLHQLSNENLVIPLKNEAGKIKSLQFIDKEGNKLFLTGGEKQGNYFTLGQASNTIYICEGYATGATIYEATNCQTIIAFDCFNIKSVSKKIREQQPDKRIIIAADNDQFTKNNPGLSKAKEAAKTIKAGVLYPEFINIEDKPTDFNDLFYACGAEELRKQLGIGKSRINLQRIDSIGFSAEPIQWLIKGYVEQGTLSCIYARPGCYKTFVMLDWALCLGAGMSWKGQKVKKKYTVVYVNGEGQRGIMRRINAWCIEHQISLDDIDLYLSEHAASLFNDPEELKQDLFNLDKNIDLICFDTLSRNTPGMEENATQDMSIVVSNIVQIQSQFNCAAAIIHHTPKGDPTSLRGSGALEGALDSGFYLEKTDGNPVIKLSCGKMKDAEPPEDLYLEAKIIDLGYENEDEEQVTSLIIDKVNAENNVNLIKSMKQKNMKKTFLELTENYWKSQINISTNPRGNYAPKIMAKRIKGRKGQNWKEQELEDIMNFLLDDGSILEVSGHQKSRGNTLKVVEKLTNTENRKNAKNDKNCI